MYVANVRTLQTYKCMQKTLECILQTEWWALDIPGAGLPLLGSHLWFIPTSLHVIMGLASPDAGVFPKWLGSQPFIRFSALSLGSPAVWWICHIIVGFLMS